RRDASLDVEFGALLDIVAKNLGASRITHKVVPFRPLLPLAAFILVPFAGCQRQVCDECSARRRFDFGILPNISKQDYLIYSLCHDCLSPFLTPFSCRCDLVIVPPQWKTCSIASSSPIG